MNPYLIPGKPLRHFVREEALAKRKIATWECTDLNELLNWICRHFDVPVERVKSESRRRKYVTPRQLFCYLAERHSKVPLKGIGELIGKRDYTTVIHSRDTVEDIMETDEGFRESVNDIENKLLLESFRWKLYK